MYKINQFMVKLTIKTYQFSAVVELKKHLYTTPFSKNNKDLLE